MKEHFRDHSFAPDAMALVEWADTTMARYESQGYVLSLRQLYYVGVTENLYPNTDASYKRLGDIVTKGRMAGLLDWSGIEDRGRVGRHQSYWGSPAEIIASAAQSFKINKWEHQPNHVEVVIEKSALEGVVIPVCDRFQVPFHANKGYSSASALYGIGKRLQERASAGKKLFIVALFDHDPSGLDMGRDLADRLSLFSQSEVTVMRVALNIKQVQRYQLAENPTKLTDTRAPAYVSRFGHSCWELDALEPPVLAGLVKAAILSLRDEAQWTHDLEREDKMKEQIQSTIDGLH